ncbi:MAG TPA: YncE family protein [Nitrospiria bacterium]|nr:YncE family protein [Nitrospiria bacterium]
MKIRKRSIGLCMLLMGGFLVGAWVLVNPAPASAAGETCPNGSSAPCSEDIQMDGCNQCHSIRITGGNRDGTDRVITASAGVNRHIDDPKIADWTSIVVSMISKGSAAVQTPTAGYLNTNYCTGCNGPILGSPVASAITDTTATVTWSTSYSGFEDEMTDTVLYYGTNQADVLLGSGCSSCQHISVPTPTTGHHVVNLTGLTGFTQYFLVNQATSSHGTVKSLYTVDFRTKRGGGGGGGGGECTGGDPPIPSRIYLSNNPSSSSSDTDRIVVIDPVTQAQISSIPSNGDPGELAAHPDGSTLYAVEGSSVAIIDVLGNVQLSTLLGVGDLFNLLAVSPDGNKLYLLYRKSTGTATLILKTFDLSADPTAPTLTSTLTNPVFDGCYGPLGLGVKPDGSKLYLACRPTSSSLPDRFYTVDTATNTPTQTATFTRDSSNYTFINAMAVKPDGSAVYLARTVSSSGSTIEIFDGGTGANTGHIKLPANSLPRALAFIPDGTKLYAVDQSLGTQVIDATTNTLLYTMPKTQSRGFDIALNTDGVHLYTSLTQWLFVLDKNSDTWVSTITGDFTSAYQVTVTPGRAGTPLVCPPPSGGGAIPSTIYASNNSSASSNDTDRIVAIDPVTRTEITSIPASGEPGELAFTPDGSTLYAVEGSSIAVIDVLGNVQLSTLLGVGDLFNQLAVSPDGSKLYLLYRKSTGTATLILKTFDLSDPTAPTLTSTLTDPSFDGCYGPLGLGVKPDGSMLYVACRPADSSKPDQFYTITGGTPTLTTTFTRDSSNYTFINAMAVKPDGSAVYLARAQSGSGSTIEVFDGSSGANTAHIALPSSALPRAIAVTPDGNTLYVADQVLGTHVISTATNTRLLTMPQTKSRGFDVALNPDGSLAYTSLLTNVFVLDTPTNTWLSTITGDFSSLYQIVVTPGHSGS